MQGLVVVGHLYHQEVVEGAAALLLFPEVVEVVVELLLKTSTI